MTNIIISGWLHNPQPFNYDNEGYPRRIRFALATQRYVQGKKVTEYYSCVATSDKAKELFICLSTLYTKKRMGQAGNISLLIDGEVEFVTEKMIVKGFNMHKFKKVAYATKNELKYEDKTTFKNLTINVKNFIPTNFAIIGKRDVTIIGKFLNVNKTGKNWKQITCINAKKNAKGEATIQFIPVIAFNELAEKLEAYKDCQVEIHGLLVQNKTIANDIEYKNEMVVCNEIKLISKPKNKSKIA